MDEREEREFTVRGGLLWFHHVLVAAVEMDKTYQVSCYAEDAHSTPIDPGVFSRI